MVLTTRQYSPQEHQKENTVQHDFITNFKKIIGKAKKKKVHGFWPQTRVSAFLVYLFLFLL